MEKKFKGIKKLLAYVAAVALPVFGVVIGGGKDVYAANTVYTAPNGVIYTWDGTSKLTLTGSGVTDDSWKSCAEFSGLDVQQNIKTVVFNNANITAIGSDSFSECPNLATITWTKHSITSIGDRAFKGDLFTSTITVPETVTHIGSEAYRSDGNTKVTTINIKNNASDIEIGSNAFAGLTKLATATIGAQGSQKAIMADDAFNGAPLKTVTINTASIAETKAFQGNTTLTSITFPYTANIPAGICKDCTGLTTVPSIAKTTDIGASAFENCTSLSKAGQTSVSNQLSVPIVDNINIGSRAFAGCTNLKKAVLGGKNSQLNIAQDVFTNSGVADITINANTITGDYAFQGNTTLTTITFPNLTEAVPEGICKDCTGLTKVSSLGSATSIGASAFEGCSALVQVGGKKNNIEIPKTVEYIGDRAFGDTFANAGNGLRSIYDPAKGLQNFGDKYKNNYIYINEDSEFILHGWTGKPVSGGSFDNWRNALVTVTVPDNYTESKYLEITNSAVIDGKNYDIKVWTYGGGADLPAYFNYGRNSHGDYQVSVAHNYNLAYKPQTPTMLVRFYDHDTGEEVSFSGLVKAWGLRDEHWRENKNPLDPYEGQVEKNHRSKVFIPKDIVNNVYTTINSYLTHVATSDKWLTYESTYPGTEYQGEMQDQCSVWYEVNVTPENPLTMKIDMTCDSFHIEFVSSGEIPKYFGYIATWGDEGISETSQVNDVEQDLVTKNNVIGKKAFTKKHVADSNATITPVVKDGYRFVRWEEYTGDEYSLVDPGTKKADATTNTSHTVKVIKDETLYFKAITEKDTVNLTTWGDAGIKTTTQGSAVSTDNKEFKKSYNKDTKVTVKATLDDKYDFVSWDEYDKYDGTKIKTVSTSSTYEVTLTKDTYLKAVTKLKQVNLTTWGDAGIRTTTQNSVKSTNNAEFKKTYNIGTETTVSAEIIDSSYKFIRWDKYDAYNGKLLGTASTSNTYKFTLNENTYLKAVTEKLYKATCIDVAEKVGGTELGRPTNPANPKTGLSNGTKVSGSEWGTDSPYANYAYDSCTTETINNGDVIVYRIFKLNQINLTTWGDAGVSTTTQNSVESTDNAEFKKAYNVGTQVTVSAKVAANHKFVRWDKYDAYNGKLLGTASTSNTYKFTLNENTYLKAVTEEVLYKADCYSRIKGTTTNIAGPATKTGLANGTKVEGNNTGYFGDIPAVITYQGKDYAYTKEYTTETINGADVTVYRYYTEVLYNAVCIDVIGDINGTELGRPAPNPKTGLSNGTKVSGSDWGTDSPYPFFDYKTCTTETINKGDVTVYRIFEPQKSIIYDVEQGKAGDGIKLTAGIGGKTYNILSLKGGDGAAAWAAQHADDCPFIPLSADNKTKLAATLNVNTGAGTTNILGKTVNASGQIPNVIKDDNGKTVVKFIKELDETPDFAGTADVKWEVVPAIRIDYNDGTEPVPGHDMLFTDDDTIISTTVPHNYGSLKKFIGFNTKWNGKGRDLGKTPEFNAALAREIMEEQGTNIATVYAIYEKVTVLQPNY